MQANIKSSFLDTKIPMKQQKILERFKLEDCYVNLKKGQRDMAGFNNEKSSGRPLASGSNLTAETSSANHSEGKFCKGKELMYASDQVQLLSERLRSLEEEAEVMNQAFIESLEERKKLINEISHQFRVISHYRVYGKQDSTGLSQVLHQESNPSLVIRNRKLKASVGCI